MKRIFTLIAVLAALVACNNLYAQQDPHFTQFINNKFMINPAFTGSESQMQTTLVSRRQWSDFRNNYNESLTEDVDDPFYNYDIQNRAPWINMFNINTAFGRKSIADRHPLGIGLTVMDQTLGFERRFHASLSLAYHIEFTSEALWKSGNRHLFFGMNAGVNQFRINPGSDFDAKHSDDQVLNNVGASTMVPDLGAGIMFKNNAYYIGVSLSHLLENDISYYSFQGATLEATQARHINVMAGLNIKFKPKITEDGFEEPRKMILNPNILIKQVAGAPVQFDLTTRLVSASNEKWWVGTNYRYNDAASLMLGFNLAEYGVGSRESQKFLVGYSYDFSTTWFQSQFPYTYNSGTHELMIRFDINTEVSKNSKYDGGRNGKDK